MMTAIDAMSIFVCSHQVRRFSTGQGIMTESVRTTSMVSLTMTYLYTSLKRSLKTVSPLR